MREREREREKMAGKASLRRAMTRRVATGEESDRAPVRIFNNFAIPFR